MIICPALKSIRRERNLANRYNFFGDMNNAENKYIPAEIVKVVKANGQIISAIIELLILLRILFTNNFEN